MELCCAEMKDAVKYRDVMYKDNGTDVSGYFMWGEPLYDKYGDNLTDELKINFCPFCGKSL
jgi:hypothetical protein